MSGFFSCPIRALRLANQLLVAGLLLLLLGLAGAYGLDKHLGLRLLVGAHALTILGPSLLKLGYVLRLAAQQQLSRQGAPCCAIA
ncbi:transmembrane sensor/regulator PpyR [Pseudomonas taeanensis MS-3]|jgi:hypothetical protein|uniref:Transmembrane sensor/regulator PpyR n=1 Tax=Pseudomonas taeanensis MS-3 TaxID=1395571 RepID=A0A0A1YNU6_9PSED|nr:hypothetical protein [Pseudomonas taeanensis]KFX70761.1 transmembrane sensor/regulator PpyR [Pseudomonas taeanensis MS-3]